MHENIIDEYINYHMRLVKVHVTVMVTAQLKLQTSLTCQPPQRTQLPPQESIKLTIYTKVRHEPIVPA